MRFLVAVVILGIAACGGHEAATGDAGGSGSDAANGDAPVPVTFTPVMGAAGVSPQDWVRGPGGKIYAQQGGSVVASSDNGVSWQPVTSGGGGLAATSTTLFVVGGTSGMKRSTDGATFADVTVPGFASANFRAAIAATPTVLWLETQSGAEDSKLYRSTDQGDSFATVTPPVATSALLFFTIGGEYVFMWTPTGHMWRTLDGTTWDDLGTPVANPYGYVGASAAGTLFVGAQRRALGDATFSSTGASNYVLTSQRENGQLVRIAQAGATVETSDNDGTTWSATSVPAIATCSIGMAKAFDAVVLAQCIEGTQYSLLRLLAAVWTRAEPDSLPVAVRPVDISFSSAGRIFVATTDGIYASDDATHWHHLAFAPGDGWPIRTMAVSPNGQRIYVGSSVERYAFLDGAGVITSQGLMPIDQTELPNASHWSSDQIVYVTTSSSDDYKGHLLNGDPDRIGTWESVNPYRNESNPQLFATAGYHGVEACGALAVGARVFVSAQAYQAELRVQFQPSDPFMSVTQPYSPLPVASISCAPNGTQSFIVGDANDQFLYVGNLISPKFAPVMTSDLQGDLRVARFSPDNRLWVITELGLWRSTAAVDGH